jgi:hypothetical protein
MTNDNLGNGLPVKLRDVRANGLSGASISDCGSKRRGLTR